MNEIKNVSLIQVYGEYWSQWQMKKRKVDVIGS